MQINLEKVFGWTGALCLVVALASCGGGGGGSVPNSGPTPTPAQGSTKIAVSYRATAAASAPTTIMHTPKGDTISVFVDPTTKKAIQVTATTVKDGRTTIAHLDSTGAVTKVVDSASGGFATFAMRKDGLGNDILMYDNKGKFQAGYTIFRTASGWAWARVVGKMPQISVTLSGAISGSATIDAVNLVYGKATNLSANTSAWLTGIQPQITAKTAAVSSRLAGGSSAAQKANIAAAQSSGNSDIPVDAAAAANFVLGQVIQKNMQSAGADPLTANMIVNGAVAAVTGAAVLPAIAAGAVSYAAGQYLMDAGKWIWSKLAGDGDKTPPKDLTTAVDDELDEIDATGPTALASAPNPVFDSLSGNIPGVNAPTLSPDGTPAVAAPPDASNFDEPFALGGSANDASGNTYSLSGTATPTTAGGLQLRISVSGSNAGNDTLTITGLDSVSPVASGGDMSVLSGGQYVWKGANGTTASGTVSDKSAPPSSSSGGGSSSSGGGSSSSSSGGGSSSGGSSSSSGGGSGGGPLVCNGMLGTGPALPPSILRNLTGRRYVRGVDGAIPVAGTLQLSIDSLAYCFYDGAVHITGNAAIGSYSGQVAIYGTITPAAGTSGCVVFSVEDVGNLASRGNGYLGPLLFPYFYAKVDFPEGCSQDYIFGYGIGPTTSDETGFGP